LPLRAFARDFLPARGAGRVFRSLAKARRRKESKDQYIDNYYDAIIIPPCESRYFELKAVSVDTICPNCSVVWHVGFDLFENGRLAMDKGLKVSLKIK
jgi:hypothetical protein